VPTDLPPTGDGPVEPVASGSSHAAPERGAPEPYGADPYAPEPYVASYTAGRSHKEPEPPAVTGHSHAAPEPASRWTKHLVIGILAPLAAITLIALIVLWPGDVPKQSFNDDQERAYGEVTRVVEEPCPANDPANEGTPAAQRRCGSAAVSIKSGTGRGSDVKVDLPQGPGAPSLHSGDDVVLVHLTDAAAGSPEYTVIEHQRGKPLVWLLILAAFAIVAFGRWRGLTAIAGLALSFALLLMFVIPAILTGESPLLIAVVGCSAIMFAVLYLTHGVNVQTSVAVLGTLVSLVLTGLLGAGFTAFTELTGIGDDQSAFLSTFNSSVDMRGLLLAGIIIGSLGVLDDVTVTQAATVNELARSPLSRLQLYRSATRIGRAHVASAVNTIVLAYAGASLPLLLLITSGSQPLSELLTSQTIAQEIVRAAVGTIGLVASVPITTALAAMVADRGAAVVPARRRHRTG